MITLSVPEMSCAHCKASVEAALGNHVAPSDLRVDLANRQVQIAGAAQPTVLVKLLGDIGFSAKVVAA